jgi:hypothetical protein
LIAVVISRRASGVGRTVRLGNGIGELAGELLLDMGIVDFVLGGMASRRQSVVMLHGKLDESGPIGGELGTGSAGRHMHVGSDLRDIWIP